MNSGYRQLTREVFIAVADFTVPKSGDLHSAGMPAVTLRAERRVAKFRVLLKDKPSPVNAFTFETTAHTVQALFTSQTKPFAEGIDALGNMYYGASGIYEPAVVHVDDGRFPHIGSGQISNVSDQFDGLFALPFRRTGSRRDPGEDNGHPDFGQKRRIQLQNG